MGTEPALILVTNDDGVGAPGLDILVEHLEGEGEVWVVAPAEEQSAVGHGISLARSLRMYQNGPRRFAVTGTPADAVIMAIHRICPRPPDLIVSGINHGLNLGTDVFYSGTVAGAMEGAIRGLTGLAVSQDIPAKGADGGDDPELPLARTARFAARVARSVIKDPLPPGTMLNLNAPDNLTETFVWTGLGPRVYREKVEKRLDLRGVPYYWIGGPPLDGESEPGTDSHALEQGLISVTHLGLDLTVKGPSAQGAGQRSVEGFSELHDAPPAQGDEHGAGGQ